MPTKKTRTATIVGGVVLAASLVLGGAVFVGFRIHKHAVQRPALVRLKADNPVEYFILHTPLIQTEDELKSQMAGAWELAGAKSLRTGGFVRLESPQNCRKTFTLTNWAMIARDNNSNVLYTASGHYALRGENCTESVEAATGAKVQFLGTQPTFRIRLDRDKFYEMGLGKNPSVEQMWQRVGD